MFPLPSEGDHQLPFPFSKAPCGEQRLISYKGQGRPNWCSVGGFLSSGSWQLFLGLSRRKAQTTWVGTGSPPSPPPWVFREVGPRCCSRTSGFNHCFTWGRGGRAGFPLGLLMRQRNTEAGPSSRAHLFPAPGHPGRQRLVPGSAMHLATS